MNIEKWFEDKIKFLKNDLDFKLEELILKITENICIRMEERKLSRIKLAKKLNVSPPAITKILKGNNNFTLKTLLSLANALEQDLKVEFVDSSIAIEKTIHASKGIFNKT